MASTLAGRFPQNINEYEGMNSLQNMNVGVNPMNIKIPTLRNKDGGFDTILSKHKKRRTSSAVSSKSKKSARSLSTASQRSFKMNRNRETEGGSKQKR